MYLQERDLVDKRTEAEKKYDDYLAKVEEKKFMKVANKSHRERVREFNDYLAN